MASEVVTPIDVRRRLVGLDQWLDAAALSHAEYTDAEIARIIPHALRRFERESQFRLSQIQVVANPDGTYNHPNMEMSADGNLPLYVEDPYPFYPETARHEYLVTTLQHRPVASVQRVRIMIDPSIPVIVLPSHWYRIDRRTGRFFLVPWSGSYQATSTAAAFPLIFDWGNRKMIPHALAVDYIAGLPDGWQAKHEWGDLLRCLHEVCALEVLNDISNTFDAGIAAKAVGADGLSQSRQYDRFQLRKQELQMSIDKFLQTFKAQETPVLLTSV